MPTHETTADLRIRLEGRVEHIEALTQRWRSATTVLKSRRWHDWQAWLPLASSDEREAEAIEALRAHPELKPALDALLAARKQATEAAQARLKELHVEHFEPGRAVLTQLRKHTPVFSGRFRGYPFNIAGLAVMGGVSLLYLVAMTLLLITLLRASASFNFANAFCLIFMTSWVPGLLANRRFNARLVSVTDHTFRIGGDEYELAKIESIKVMRAERYRTIGLELRLAGGETAHHELGGDDAELLAALRASGIELVAE